MMTETKSLNNEVYIATERIVNVGILDIQSLKEKVGNNERKRIRLCTHQEIEDKLHEMFIVLLNDVYIRPHKHLNKAESLHVIEGNADAVFFDEVGHVTRVISLGEYSSARRFYYRIEEPIYHTLLIRSDHFIFHETTQGPFKRSDTLFAPWAPEEGDIGGIRDFTARLARDIVRFRSPMG